LVGTCRLCGVNPLEYLADVIIKLRGGWLKSRLHELLPEKWLAARDRERVSSASAA
jgi:hypothetical protein